MASPTTRSVPCPKCGAIAGKACRSLKSGKPLPDNHAARQQRMISINEAVAQGVERLRKPNWANGLDHVKIDLIDGLPGPWAHICSPHNLACNGRDPVDILLVCFADPDSPEFCEYAGPHRGSPEYAAAERESMRLWNAGGT